MQLSSTVAGPRTLITANGDLDIATAAELRQYLHERADDGAHSIVVDLSGVDFLDSSTLGVLVSVHKRLMGHGGALSLICPQERILRIFRMTALDRVFAIHPTAAEALS